MTDATGLTPEEKVFLDALGAPDSLKEQLLYTAVIQLMRDVGRLKKKVSDLEARESI